MLFRSGGSRQGTPLRNRAVLSQDDDRGINRRLKLMKERIKYDASKDSYREFFSNFLYYYQDFVQLPEAEQIGRASCRERV